jgi:ABC-type dipeptide/oligopeptide/nickel transport system permease subunit
MSTSASELPLQGAEADAGAIDLISAGEIAARSPRELFVRRFREDKFALVGLGFLTLLILVAIFAPLVCSLLGAPGPYRADQNALDIFGQPTGPSSAHLFGVDQIGRDVFSRVIYGARVSLLVAFVATAITTTFGVFCGLLAGYYRGWVDTLVSRTVDAWLAIPYLLLAIGLASSCSFGNGCLGVGTEKVGHPGDGRVVAEG